MAANWQLLVNELSEDEKEQLATLLREAKLNRFCILQIEIKNAEVYEYRVIRTVKPITQRRPASQSPAPAACVQK